MKHKNPAPQTREMDIIVWCHNTHFKKHPQHHPGCHGLACSSAWGRGGTLAPSSCWPQWKKPHFHQNLVGWGNSTDSTVPPEQLSWWWMGCKNAPISPQPWAFILKPSQVQTHHGDPHFSRCWAGCLQGALLSSGALAREPLPAVQLPLSTAERSTASKDLEIIPFNSHENHMSEKLLFLTFNS